MQNMQNVALFSVEPNRTEGLIELQAAALEVTANAVVITDQIGTVIWVNSAFEQLTGYTHAEIVGRSTRVLKSGLNPRTLYEEIWQTILGRRVWRGELINRRKNGSLYDEDMTITPIKDRKGEITHYIANKLDITARKRVEEHVRMLAMAVENSPELVGMSGPDGRIVYANGTLQKVLQRSMEEFVGKHFHCILSQNNSPALLQEIESKSSQPGGWKGKCLVPRKDGTDLPVLLSLGPITEEDGQVLGILGIAQDISEHERDEERCSLLSQAIENTSELIGIGDTNANITFANQAWLHALGYSEQELIGQSFRFILSPNNSAELLEEINANTFAGGWRGECLHRRKDGTDLPVLLSTGILKDREGSFAGVFGIARDITERKRTEEELRRLAMIVENSDDAIISRTLDGIIASWNGGAEQMYGYSAAEAIGQPISIIFPHDQQATVPAMLEEVNRGAKVKKCEAIRTKKDGKQIHISLNIFPIKNASGRVVGAASISRDITAGKQMEEMFRQAQKMEAVGRLAGGVAHDFNNMLSVIIGYSEMLAERADIDGQVRAQCMEIKRAGDRAAVLTRQLLAFSRQQVLESRVLDLNTSVTDIEKMLRRLIGEDIEFRTSLDPALGAVKADAGQIEQVIMNLAVNARDAMPHGGKLIIETSNADVDDEYVLRHPLMTVGRYVLLTVTDSGEGISEETKAHIFEPFFTTKEHGKGTGLGLSTVYGVVKQSGGFIWVYSAPGQGSVFKIYLPRVDGSEMHIRPIESAPEVLRGTETILLVEDEQSVRALTHNLLEQSGYTVLDADNGAHAVEIAVQYHGPIHLLLTDVVMPGMNGPAITDKILPIHPEAKTLYVSGYSGSFGTQTGLVPEGADLLQKPFSRSALLRKLRNILDVQKKSENT
jgi:PAS domain S-box-containing protein